MTVSVQTSFVVYTGNSSATNFPFTFRVDDSDTLYVTLIEISSQIETPLVLDTDFSVTGIGDPNGGAVTYPLVGSPMANTHKLKIERIVPMLQDLDITNQSGFQPEVLELALDYMTMMVQQTDAKILDVSADAAASAAAADASADSAAASASSAASSLAATLAAYDNFDDRYLGPKASDPTLDNDGNPLIGGALYFNTTVGEIRVWTGSAWVAAYVPGSLFLPLAGGTMTGFITLHADPDAAMKASTKQYVDNHDWAIGDVTGLQAALDGKLDLTGGTLTGDLSISKAAGNSRSIVGETSGSFRWKLSLGDNAAESGGDAGSAFTLDAYNDAGVYVDTVMSIGRTVSSSIFLRRDIDMDRAAGNERAIQAKTNGSQRWKLALGDATAESGGNAGSNIALKNYDDAGALIDTIFDITRSSGDWKFYKKVKFGGSDNFYAVLNAGNPEITFDANDNLTYDRTNNRFRFNINSVTYLDVGTDTGGNDGVICKKKTFFENGYKLNTGVTPAVVSDGTFFVPGTTVLQGRLNGQTALYPAYQFMSLSATYTLANQQAAQKAFNTPANGSFNAKANTAYEFEGFISLSSMSSSSGSFGFALAGTATTSQVHYDTIGNKATLATAAAPQATVNAGTTLPVANTAIVTSTTATVGWMKIKGIVRVTGAGTLIPQVSLGVAAAAVVGIDSYFKFTPLGPDTVTTQGDMT